jgi:hypothetical protein
MPYSHTVLQSSRTLSQFYSYAIHLHIYTVIPYSSKVMVFNPGTEYDDSFVIFIISFLG